MYLSTIIIDLEIIFKKSSNFPCIIMNIVSYFTYPVINQNIVAPALKFVTTSYNEPMSYAGWGVIGVYLGGTLSLFRKRAVKKIVRRRA